MRSLYILAVTMTIILNSIEISSGTSPKTRDFLANFGMINEHTNYQELSSQSETLPDGAPMRGVTRYGPSYFSDRNSSGRTLPLARPHSSANTHSSSQPSLRARSKSPSPKYHSITLLGYKIEELRFIRFIPNKYPNRIFELRKYAFPPDERIQLRIKGGNLGSMPAEEKLVLSTSNGDVFATLEQAGRKSCFRGIYQPFNVSGKRAKINMYSGTVKELTTEEIAECPISQKNPILKNYRIVRV